VIVTFSDIPAILLKNGIYDLAHIDIRRQRRPQFFLEVIEVLFATVKLQIST
jgi:hypothetical protein